MREEFVMVSLIVPWVAMNWDASVVTDSNIRATAVKMNMMVNPQSQCAIHRPKNVTVSIIARMERTRLSAR